MRKFMKLASIFMAALVVCVLIAGCGRASRDPEPSGEVSRTASEPTEGEPESADASAGEPEAAGDVEKLRVLTDLDSRWAGSLEGGGLPAAVEGKKAFANMLEHFGIAPQGLAVELEVLPVENSDYDAQLTHLRTEIMSGGGPDVFLLSCGYSGRNGNAKDLFPNPEHAMFAGFFLPLDEYLPKARLMEWDKLEPVVMAAGRTQQGQMLLPVFYSLPFGVLLGEEGPVLPGDWNEALGSELQGVKDVYADCLMVQGLRAMAFEQVADNENEELLITKEELLQRVKEAVELSRGRMEIPAEESGSSVEGAGQGGFLPKKPMLTFDEISGREREGVTWFAPKNPSGGITAQVTLYCGINRNTKHPAEAFDIVDMLMSKDFQRLEVFWNNTARKKQAPVRMFATAAGSGIPVHRDILSTEEDSMLYQQISAAQRQALDQARAGVSFCYFPSNADEEMKYLFLKCQGMSDEEMEREVGKCYTTMGMMLGEA